MLFLAVFLGFLAENLREHQVEKEREIKYIASLIKDVELDIASLEVSYDLRKSHLGYFDSLITLLKQGYHSQINIFIFMPVIFQRQLFVAIMTGQFCS